MCQSVASARRAAKFIGEGTAQSLENLAHSDSDVFVLSVPDDDLSLVAKQLSGLRTYWKKSVVLHTSGSQSSAVLQAFAKSGASVGSMHPLLSFSSPKLAVNQIAGGYFCIEGHKRAMKVARLLIRALGAKAFEISPSDKSKYHAAAVMASPLLTSLLSLSIELLEQCGLPEKTARAVLMPLISSTIENLARQGAVDSLTGPVRRADLTTVERNLKAIGQKNSLANDVYRILSMQAAKLSQTAGVPDEKLAPLVSRLKEFDRMAVRRNRR